VQVDLASGADVEHLAELDQKLWVALACPTRGLQIESRTLDFVDTDHDGRIRPPEVLGAIAWAKDVFKNLDDLFKSADEVPLASINDGTPSGKELLAGAKRILENLGKPTAASISLADVGDTSKIFGETKFNGDGVVPADSAEDPETKRAIEDVIAALGSVPDRSGKPGIDQPKADAFFDRVAAWQAWLERGDVDPAVRPFGERTAAAAGALAAVAAKVDDYFVRCGLGAYDERLGPALGAGETAVADLASKNLGTDDAVVEKFPLARPNAGRALPLASGINPTWAAKLGVFARSTVATVFGTEKTSLTEAEWAVVNERLAPYRAWQASKPPDPEIEKLGDVRVRELTKSTARAAVTELVTRDAALATESNQIESVEKMLRFRRDFVRLLRNFVNFAEFYGTRQSAFQVGTLYMDGRSCDLCLPVQDVGRHAALAGLAKSYLAYCDCSRRKDAEKQTIVAAVTGGDVDNLMVGRNGVFYDRKGDDWDATITKIIENPISVRQAFWAPYKRFLRLVEDQIAKRASAADDEANKKLQAQALATAQINLAKKDPGAPAAQSAAAPTAAPPPADKKVDIGTVAAIGVAVGGIATFFSSILATFLGLGMWMPVGVAALLLGISGPSMLIAWLKLRQRNIGPILDANGWAVNAFARINVPFGGALTAIAALPPGASRSFEDPFAEKRRPWRFYLFVLVVLGIGVAWFLGEFDLYLPEPARAAKILHRPEVVPATPVTPSAK